jgi:hypothetical protein
MANHTITTPGTAPKTASCDRETSITKTLLAYGVLAGPVYVLVSLTEALTRDGFDLTRHAWSLLANGDLGWIHITNLVLSGLMTVALAAGLRRVLRPGRGGTWAPRLVGAYGVGMVCAGAFRADPALGFPAGTPQTQTEVSWHGILHFVSAGIGFLCLVAACFVLARRFSAEGRRGWAVYSRLTGVLFLAGFAGVASGAGGSWANLGFTAAVLLACAWVAAVAAHFYRRVAPQTDK